MCDFELLKQHNQTTKAIVSYFINESQRLFNDKQSSYYNIPSLIVGITILYYQHHEYFTLHGTKLKLNHTMNIIKSYGSYTRYSISYNTVYGNININECNENILYKWTFKITRDIHYRGIFAIGIDSSNKRLIETCYYDKKWNPNNFYALQFDEYMACKFSQKKTYGKYTECDYKEITIVSMELNTIKKTIKYNFDGNDKGIAFNDIDFSNNQQYYVAIMIDNNAVIQLVDFYQK